MSRTCDVCSAETSAFICWTCTEQIEAVLTDLPTDIADLEAVMSRQARGPMGMGDPEREWKPEHAEPSKLPARLRSLQGPVALPSTAWPYAPGAADLLWAVQNTLTTWVRHLVELRGLDMPAFRIRVEASRRLVIHRNRMFVTYEYRWLGWAPLIEWLSGNLDAIRMDEAAEQIHDEFTWLGRAVDRAVVGRREPDVYAGRCDLADVRVAEQDGVLSPYVATCGADLYARKGDGEVQCGTCGAVYDLAERKADLAKRIDNEWARPHIIATGLTSLDEPVKADTLYKWIERGLIKSVSRDDDGHALYRVGDVRERIEAARLRKTRRECA